MAGIICAICGKKLRDDAVEDRFCNVCYNENLAVVCMRCNKVVFKRLERNEFFFTSLNKLCFKCDKKFQKRLEKLVEEEAKMDIN